ncbi:MAG TPA: M1 family aminopeptidase [Anaerolineales bacterium]|nr:M1 family aminopeptidase [Anaerolineales bacterium]
MQQVRSLFLTLWVILPTLSACTPDPAPPVPATDQVWTAEASPSADPAASETAAAEPTGTGPTGDPSHGSGQAHAPPPERPVYRLAAVLDHAERKLEVALEIVYPNRTGTDLAELVLIVDAAREAGVFELVDLRLPDGPAPEKWTLADGVLTIELADPVPAETAVAVEIDYRLQLPRRPGKLAVFNGQLNLGDWYPMFPEFRDGEGWLVRPAHVVGETIVYPLADFEVLLEVRNGPGGLVVAAPAPLEHSDNDYRFTAPGYRNVTLSMSDRYVVDEAMAGEVVVLGYAYREHEFAAAAALEAAVRAIEIYSELFGPYPHERYTIVAGNFPDGLEFDGLTFVSMDYYGWYDGTIRNYLPLLVVHEAAHQWWYGRVGNDPAMEPWLDESLAIYCELLYLELAYPDEPADWWWILRMEEFRPLGGNVDDTVYDHGGYRPYVNAIYLRGAELMHALRIAMGDEAFFEALRAYAERFDGEVATGEGLIAVFEEYSEEDLGEVWDNYFGD